MEEPALMSHGYICCGIYRVYEMVDESLVYVGEMSAEEVMKCIRREGVSYKVEKVPGTATSCCVYPYTDEPQVFYVSARNCR
jgi:hypothetical protein